MKSLLNATAFAAAAIVVSSLAAVAADSTPAMPNGAMGATFDYTIGVQTSKGKKSSSGQIVVRPAGTGKLTLTVTSSDGTSKTIPLAMENGTIVPAMPSPSASSVPAAAQTLMANLKLAATVGVAAKKSGGQAFNAPVTLRPIGEGTPVPAQISMKPGGGAGNVTYSGTVGGTSLTTLPPSSGIDPAQLVKSAGVGMVSHGFTPAGRIATAVAMHHRTAEEKKAAQGAVADAMSLTIDASFNAGTFHAITGAQTDELNLGGKKVKIYSTWSFTRVAP
ncbi:MAG TPA: hypothetical protein VGG89_00995 [Candidatus Baltobacteraceae bacterium]|jgi:hypothetical protein